MKAQGRSRGIGLLILNLGARWGWVVNATPGRFTPESMREPLGRSRRAWRREKLPHWWRREKLPHWRSNPEPSCLKRVADYPIPSLHTHTHTHTHTHSYIYIYIYIYTHTHTHTHAVYINVRINVNIEARSCNHCCRGKEMSTTYAEYVAVALVIKLAMRMRCIILLSVASLALQFYSILSHTWYVSQKKVIEHMCVLIFSTTFVWNISYSNNKWARYYHKCT